MWVGLRGERQKELDERSGLYDPRGCESRRDGKAIWGDAGGCGKE